MLNVQRRHRSPCKRPMWDAGYVKCGCPIVIRGTLAGKHITLSTAKFLPPDQVRNLEEARALALLWQRSGKPVRPEFTLVPEIVSAQSTAETPAQITIEAAVRAYMTDSRDRGLAEATISKKTTMFERQLIAFACDKGLRFVSELGDLQMLRQWRASWKVNALTRSKRQKATLGFLWFSERNGWFPPNTAHGLTAGLGRIEVKPTQTGYFTPDQYQKILQQTEVERDGGLRLRTVIELMRWTGLRIRDAVTLEKNRLAHDPATGMSSIFLYQAKTGEPVYCPIPPHVAQLLRTVPDGQKGAAGDAWFFWTGEGKPKSAASMWERTFCRFFKLVNLREPSGEPKRAFPHMFRDTFAVEALLAGVPLVEVSKLLGHSSVKVTEAHYMPWVRARQHTLNQVVMASWERQGIVAAPVPPAPKRRARVVPIHRAG